MKHILVTVPVSQAQREALQAAAPQEELRFRLGESLPSGRGGALPFPDLLPAEAVTPEEIGRAHV